jgi:hypothetical protein
VDELAPATIRIEKVEPVAPHGNKSTLDGVPLVLLNMTPFTLVVRVDAYAPVVIVVILW